MNSARDKAENIIDELQEFLRRQTSSDSDLDISYSSSQADTQSPVANGGGADRYLDRWGSFQVSHTKHTSHGNEKRASWTVDGGSLLDQATLAESSEMLMPSGSEVTMGELLSQSQSQHGVTASLTVTHGQLHTPPGHVTNGGKEAGHVTNSKSDKGDDVTGRGVGGGGHVTSSKTDDGRGGLDNRHRALTVSVTGDPTLRTNGEGGGKETEGLLLTDAKVRVSEKTLHTERVVQMGGTFSSGVSGGTHTHGHSHGQAEAAAAAARSLSSSSSSSSSAGDAATSEQKHVTAAAAAAQQSVVSTSTLSTQHTSSTMTAFKQNSQIQNGVGQDETTTQEMSGYDFLEPASSPPPPKEFRDSAVMPFPMIFRRSKKDPGSKQYNALVKELEQVLEKRNDVRRSRCMRDDMDLDSIPESVGSLRSSRKLSNSMDNLSIFANKALLNRLESHLKNRGSPGSIHRGEKPSPETEESPQSKFGVVLKSPGADGKSLKHPKFPTSSESNTTQFTNGHTTVSVGQPAWPTAERQSSSFVSTSPPGNGHSVTHDPYAVTHDTHPVTPHGHNNAVSVVLVSSDTNARTSRSRAGHVINGHTDSSNLSPHSVHEQESFSQDMSFGSDDDFPAGVWGHGSSTLPNYRKHNHAGRSSASTLHRSSFSPDVMYRSQTLDSNSFRHITRISVSKSMDSLPTADNNYSILHTHHNPHHGHDPQHRWTLDRQGSVPMKTIVEHFNETDPDEIPAWNAAVKNSKKHKDRGVYRSISQRMVQKIFRVVKPSSKPTNPAAVSRSSSFSPSSRHVHNTSHNTSHNSLPVDDTYSSRNSASRISGAEDIVVELPSQQKLAVVALSDKHVRSESRSVSGDVSSHGNEDSGDGKLMVQLPNNHIANIVPVGTGWRNITTVNSADHSVVSSGTSPHHQSHTLQRGTTPHSANNNSLTVQLPNNHKANIIPTLPGTLNASRESVHVVGGSNIGNGGVKLSRSASAAGSSSNYRQTYRPVDKGSPFTQEIGEGVLPPAHGDGLYRGEEDKPATFYIDARGMTGEPSVQVDGPNSIAKCSIDPQHDGQYAVTYIPVEVGLFDVQVKWNGKELHGSPFHPKVVCARKVQVVGGWQHYMDAKERVHLVVNEEKQIPFDTSEAGPGKMTAEVKSPSGLIPVTVHDSVVGRSTVTFTPREEGIHYIHLYWSDTPLVSSPFHGYATGGVADPSKVILTGRGLKEAIVREEAEFMIDASQAGAGEPEVQLTGVRAEVNVFVTPLGGGKFRCTYIPVVPGAYLLHITWNGRQLRGSPYKVNVIGAFYPNKVMVSGEGLKGGLLGRDLEVRIDTRKAGPGELTAYCMGPTKVAHCELEDHHDGTFRLIVRPQEVGRHVLQVKYGGEHVQGSPFAFKVSAQPDASKVRVSGPGVEHGILATFQSRFVVETRGAGAGQLTVRIRGPKGAFQVEMYRDSQKDRTILCRYDPCETGLYIISVRWSGVDVPGSPFHVHILDTQAELEQVMQEQSFHNASFHSRASGYQWRDEF